MKIKLSELRKIIREEVYKNNFWYAMSGMNVGGAGLSQPTVHDGGFDRVPPGLGFQSGDKEEMENEEINYEEEESSSRDE